MLISERKLLQDKSFYHTTKMYFVEFPSLLVQCQPMDFLPGKGSVGGYATTPYLPGGQADPSCSLTYLINKENRKVKAKWDLKFILVSNI
ncbi:hypothetical protein C5167_015258 [Papaver somniferum]|uniref:Uncharacterized protein n=1 Tax=Papaver somniferum TaxID=3469 RepID=A0A4Y7J9W3_PAPSO|nr:hypothetical protein C5167_015258 [Papaver somniferum]